MSEIETLLPHRSPFLFVDSLELVSEERIVGHRTFSSAEFFFAGHFPQYPVVPGVILIESMAQVGGAGVRKLGLLAPTSLFFLATVDGAKFRKQVLPEQTLRFEIINLKIGPKMIRQSGKGWLGNDLACEAQWMCLVNS